MGMRYIFTTEAERLAKDRFIDETRKALAEYDPETDSAHSVVSAIGGMLILMDSVIKGLEEDETV